MEKISHSCSCGQGTAGGDQPRTRTADKKQSELTLSAPPTYRLYDISHINEKYQRRCLSIIRQIVAQVRDDQGIPLELQ